MNPLPFSIRSNLNRNEAAAKASGKELTAIARNNSFVRSGTEVSSASWLGGTWPSNSRDRRWASGWMTRLTAKYSKIACAGVAKTKIRVASASTCHRATPASKKTLIGTITSSSDSVAMGPCSTITLTADN